MSADFIVDSVISKKSHPISLFEKGNKAFPQAIEKLPLDKDRLKQRCQSYKLFNFHF